MSRILVYSLYHMLKNTANGSVAHRLVKESLNFIIQISKFYKTANKLQTYASNEALCQILTQSDQQFQWRRFLKTLKFPIYSYWSKFQKFVKNSNLIFFQNCEQSSDICL